MQDTSTTYIAYFMVNYDKIVITGFDDIIRLNCTHTTEGTEVSSDITNVVFNRYGIISCLSIADQDPGAITVAYTNVH